MFMCRLADERMLRACQGDLQATHKRGTLLTYNRPDKHSSQGDCKISLFYCCV